MPIWRCQVMQDFLQDAPEVDRRVCRKTELWRQNVSFRRTWGCDECDLRATKKWQNALNVEVFRGETSDVSRPSAPFGFRFQVDIAAVFDMFKQPASTEMPYDELKAQNLPEDQMYLSQMSM